MPVANADNLGKVILRYVPRNNFWGGIFRTKPKHDWVFQVCTSYWDDPTYGNGGGTYEYYWNGFCTFDTSEYTLEDMWKWADDHGFDMLNRKVHISVN